MADLLSGNEIQGIVLKHYDNSERKLPSIMDIYLGDAFEVAQAQLERDRAIIPAEVIAEIEALPGFDDDRFVVSIDFQEWQEFKKRKGVKNG